MSVITRLPNGSVEVVNGNITQFYTGLTNFFTQFDDAIIKLISVVDKQTIVQFVYAEIEEINGEAPPETIEEAAYLLANGVFFLNATGGGGSSYTFHNGLVDEGGGIVGLGGDPFSTGVTLSIGSNNFAINDTNSDNGLNISEANGLYIFGFADATGVFKGSELNVGHDDLFLDVYNAFGEGVEGNTAGLRFMTDGSGMFVEDLLRNVGLQNSGDYEANFTDRSLATCQWVKSTPGGLRDTDIEFTDDAVGIILKDTTDDSRRRVTLTAGVLVVSAPL